MDDHLSFNHAIYLRNYLHQCSEEAINSKILSNEDKEKVIAARDTFEGAFLDVLEFTSDDPSQRLAGIIAKLILTSAALGQLIPNLPINTRLIDDSRARYARERRASKPQEIALMAAIEKIRGNGKSNEPWAEAGKICPKVNKL